jgi:transglutaminase-like putative cysteine protease
MIAAFVRSRAVSLAVACAAAAVAVGSPPSTAWFPVLCAILPLLLGPRLELDRLAQAGLAIGAMVLGVLVPRLAGGPPASARADLLSDRTLLLVMPMVAVAAARAMVSRPVYGARVTVAAAIVALTGAGRALIGWPYVVLFSLSLGFSLFALRVEDQARPAARELSPKHLIAIGFVALVSLSSMFGLSRALPPLHDALIARLSARWEQMGRTGLSENMQLGALEGMLQSDEVVLRVRGEAPPLLRSVVLVQYIARQWNAMSEIPPREVAETKTRPDDPAAFVEIEHAKEPRRYSLPLGASDVVVSTGVLQRDVLGLHYPPAGFGAKRVWFKLGEPDTAVPVGPGPQDLRFPESVAPTLHATLASWGVDDQPPRERVAIIEERLRGDFTYSLDFDADSRMEPMVEFLTVRRSGHCEYFASAMALLARAARVPSRVVAGYRVSEVSPFGYSIVRERDAHSWVEVWLDGRWQTVDATPAASETDPSRLKTPTTSALLDALRTAWEAVDDWLGERTPFELALMLVGLFAVLILYRTLRGRRVAAKPRSGPVDPPLPAFAELVRALEAKGIAREPSLTIGGFADRLRQTERIDPAARDQAILAMQEYETLRYGAKGDEGAVAGLLERAARAVGGAPGST